MAEQRFANEFSQTTESIEDVFHFTRILNFAGNYKEVAHPLNKAVNRTLFNKMIWSSTVGLIDKMSGNGGKCG